MKVSLVWTFGWVLWILWFGVEETLAIYKCGWQATLSAHVWRLFAIKDEYGQDMRGRTVAWRVRRVLLIALMGWLSIHFLSGGLF